MTDPDLLPVRSEEVGMFPGWAANVSPWTLCIRKLGERLAQFTSRMASVYSPGFSEAYLNREVKDQLEGRVMVA